MKNSETKFSVGSIVEATGEIRRVDGRCKLRTGDIAKVIDVRQSTPESPQIIRIELPNKMIMIDIVCYENVPLKILERTAKRVSK